VDVGDELSLVLTRSGERYRTPLSDEFTRIWAAHRPKGLVSWHAEICAAALAFRRQRGDRILEEDVDEDWRDLVRGFLITPPVLHELLRSGWTIPSSPTLLPRFASTIAGGLITLVISWLWSDLASMLWLLLGLIVVRVLVLKLRQRGLRFVDPSGKRCRLADRTESGRYRLEIRRSPYPETVEINTVGIPLQELPDWLEARIERVLPVG